MIYIIYIWACIISYFLGKSIGKRSNEQVALFVVRNFIKAVECSDISKESQQQIYEKYILNIRKNDINRF